MTNVEKQSYFYTTCAQGAFLKHVSHNQLASRRIINMIDMSDARIGNSCVCKSTHCLKVDCWWSSLLMRCSVVLLCGMCSLIVLIGRISPFLKMITLSWPFCDSYAPGSYLLSVKKPLVRTYRVHTTQECIKRRVKNHRLTFKRINSNSGLPLVRFRDSADFH